MNKHLIERGANSSGVLSLMQKWLLYGRLLEYNHLMGLDD